MKTWPIRDCIYVAVCVAALACAAATMAEWLRIKSENARIAAFSAGQDVLLPRHAAAELRAARGIMLLAHDRVDDALAEFDAMGDPASQARDTLLYALANAHLKRALEIFNSAPMRQVAPLIGLAQSEYRAVLRHDPRNWDARYNFDIASALTHDPEVAAYLKGDDMARERALVPDAPGAPNGLP